MKFTAIVDELNGARNAGYTFCKEADREIDRELYNKLCGQRGQRWTDSKIESLYDLDGGLYQGEDGEMYAVEMVFCDDDWKPLTWHKLSK